MVTAIGVEAKLSDNPFDLMQRFICICYRRTSPFAEVNMARHAMFADGVSIENIPPSKGALKQHILRSIRLSTKYHKALELRPELPPPSDWAGSRTDKDSGFLIGLMIQLFWMP